MEEPALPSPMARERDGRRATTASFLASPGAVVDEVKIGAEMGVVEVGRPAWELQHGYATCVRLLWPLRASGDGEDDERRGRRSS